MTPFTQDVLTIIRSLPAGRVMTYGQVARLAGHPRSARQVARILHSMSKTERLPWHRVLAAGGKLSLEGDEQRLALEAEGVEFLTARQLDLSRYQVKSE